MKKSLIKIVLSIISILTIIIIYNIAVSIASEQKDGIESFPASYQSYLKELAKKYPNWKFSALYTGLDWNYVISQENIFGKNLVPKNYSDSWKNTTPGQYDVEVDGGWVDASKQAVEYCMDPRNFLNEVRIFQFEGLSYNSHTSNLDVVEKILYGTEFYQKQVSYFDSNGNTISMNERYSDLILRGGQTSLVSTYHLASRIKQEVGPFLTHGSISGTVEGYRGLYNFYNIGATSSTSQMGAIKKGLQYAKDGNGASQTTKDKYLIPWNSKEKAITGGAIFIGSSYINVGQNTIYLQKFDVNDVRGDGLFWHQYMTNVLAPYSEAKSIYNGYKKTGILGNQMHFIIPVFENMPEILTDSPNINKNEFIQDNTNVYCNASNVNIRTGPSTSYEIITTANNQDKMVRIQKGKQLGDKWDKVKLENGIIGYIYQTYVTELQEVQIEKIDVSIDNQTMQKGEKSKLQVTITPREASEHKVLYSSNNPNIVTVDDKGNLQAISSGEAIITVKAEENPNIQTKCKVFVVDIMEDFEIHFDSSLTLNGLEISGIDYNSNTVLDTKQKIVTDFELEFVNSKNEPMKDNDIIGTGCKVRVKENGKVLREYRFIIYGDANGDGKINSVDLLVIQRHILEIEEMKGIFKKASNINKNGNKPSSIDLLLIQRHILELQKIEQ